MLRIHPLPSTVPEGADTTPSRVALLVRRREGGANTWVLLVGSEARTWVNGIPQAVGLRRLQDRDEIRVEAGGRFFLSTESLPRIDSFPGSDSATPCPRCRREVEVETPAVCCPGCGVHYHQSESDPCFTYSPTCPTCSRSTELNGELPWTPEDL